MPDSTVFYQKKNHVGRITFSNPGAGNVINGQMLQELADVCVSVNQDEDIYAVLITGAGDLFCVGIEPGQAGMDAAAAVAAIDKPVIAAINGDALAEGLELALACDIRLASDKAHFSLAQVSTGVIPRNGGTQRLPRLIGKGKALELLLTAATIDTAEAFAIGLVSKVIASGELESEAQALAEQVASQAPVSLRYAKEAVNKGMDMTMEQGLRLEADLYLLLHTTADRTEGITAFLEKRKAEFRGE